MMRTEWSNERSEGVANLRGDGEMNDNYEQWQKHKWLAVYGAMVAALVIEQCGAQGVPISDIMQEIKATARAVADAESAGDAP